MATYGDVWQACMAAFGRGARFDVEVTGIRHRDGRIEMTWTLTHNYERLGDLEQVEASSADEMIARVRALGVEADPASVGKPDEVVA